MDYIEGATPGDFLIKFSTSEEESLLYIDAKDLAKLASLLSDFFTNNGIKNTLITRPIRQITPKPVMNIPY